VLVVLAASGWWRRASWRARHTLVAVPLARHPILALLGGKALVLRHHGGAPDRARLACVHYGRRVRAFGFTLLHGFLPSFFVDVTDMFWPAVARAWSRRSPGRSSTSLSGRCSS